MLSDKRSKILDLTAGVYLSFVLKSSTFAFGLPTGAIDAYESLIQMEGISKFVNNSVEWDGGKSG